MSEIPHLQPVASFAPFLYLEDVAAAIDFYKATLGVTELLRFSNNDCKMPVVKRSTGDAVFQICEPASQNSNLSPVKLAGTFVAPGVFVNEPDTMITKAISTCAEVIAAMQNFDYGYRKGDFKDLLAHHWVWQKKANLIAQPNSHPMN